MSSTPKIINPQTFPLDAQGLHRAVAEKFRLNQRKHWFYTNEKGEAFFVVYRVDLDTFESETIILTKLAGGVDTTQFVTD